VSADITDVLLGEVDRDQALELVARRAMETAGADLAMVLLRDEATPDGLVVGVAVAAGGEPELAGVHLTLADDVLAAVITERQHAFVEDLGRATDWPVQVETGPAVLVPLATADTVHGALVVATRRGSLGAYTPTEIGLVESFAGQAALAMDRARAQRDRALLAVLEDRDRIARDLHDLAIQRLFATGLQLQSIIGLAVRPEVVERLNQAVEGIDATIRDIRDSIFELRTTSDRDLRAEIRAVAEEARGALGFSPAVTISGPVQHTVPDQVRPHLLAVLREALANVARHANASAVSVTAAVIDGTVQLTVTDDGCGVGDATPGGGLRNMGERAATLGGTFEVAARDNGGTVLRWQVPLS